MTMTMAAEERLQMYREKRDFVADIARAFIENSKGHSIADISYEVWCKVTDAGQFFVEWILVHYKGGAKSYIKATANSNTANFRAIGNVLDHGDYDDMFTYCDQQVQLGYRKVNLSKSELTFEE